MLAAPFSWAQDGFERISTDTIEWNGHRFELLRVCELKEPLGHGVKKLINRKGEVVAVFEPGKMERTYFYGPSRLIIAGDTIVTTGNQFAQLAKNDSTIIMFFGNRLSTSIQLYNPHNGLKTIYSGLPLAGVYGSHFPYKFDQVDGIYSFGKGYTSRGSSGNPPCRAGKYSFQGDMLWELVLEGEACPGFSMGHGFRKEQMNLMLSVSVPKGYMRNSSSTFYIIDNEKGELNYSWVSSVANPGLGEFKSFVGNDKFVCLLGKEWVL